MAGVRTAPTVDTLNPTFRQVSFRWMDWTGDVRTDTYRLIATATDLQIDALAAAVQGGSNSTLYEIKVSDHFTSIPDPINAVEEVWENVNDNLVIQSKRPSGESQRLYVPSPDNGMFIEQTDAIDKTNAQVIAILAAWDIVIEVDFDVVGARLTIRRDINQQVKM